MPSFIGSNPADIQRMHAVLDETEESGWKNIHGEVFRFPPNKNLFCAFVGSGFQVSPQTCSALPEASTLLDMRLTGIDDA